MTKCNLKKQRELECVLELMKKIGCDSRQKGINLSFGSF